MLAFNAGFEIVRDEFCRIINGAFFDANETGLITRRAKIIDFIPITYDDSNEEFDRFSIDLSKKLLRQQRTCSH